MSANIFYMSKRGAGGLPPGKNDHAAGHKTDR